MKKNSRLKIAGPELRLPRFKADGRERRTVGLVGPRQWSKVAMMVMEMVMMTMMMMMVIMIESFGMMVNYPHHHHHESETSVIIHH